MTLSFISKGKKKSYYKYLLLMIKAKKYVCTKMSRSQMSLMP